MDPASDTFRVSSLLVGTSGWAYREWRSWWYPKSLPRRRWLEFYAQHFGTVELNSTFYALPPPQRFQEWARSVPEQFCFAVKAPRTLTHQPTAQDGSADLSRLIEGIAALGTRRGPILWQFPPRHTCDLVWLRSFLQALPSEVEHAVEFRHPSWNTPQVWELLQQHRVAIVWSDSLRFPSFLTVTAPFVYVRFHGLEGGYAHRYSDAELQPWAARLAETLSAGLRVYVYFNNTASTAPRDALRLQELIQSYL
ncbi:MAG: DUF72 domain-containing protein [Chlorobiota bacterium]